MKTPAQRHVESVRAQLAAAAADNGSMAGASAYDMMLVKLRADRRRLSDLQSVERKVEVKRQLLPEYTDYVNGALAGGRGAQDEVLTTILVWHIDVGDFDSALEIAEYALQHGMTMPDQYERTLATVVAEEIADAALRTFKADPAAILNTAQLQEVAGLTDAHDMPDQVRAKLHKAIAYSRMAGEPDIALLHLERALALSDKCGVKQDIARLRKQLGLGEKQPPAP